MSNLHDVESAAKYLNVTQRTMRTFIATRRIPFHKVGRYVRIQQADLDAFLAAGRVEADR